MAGADAAQTEQHFILRVRSPELAAKLRGWLRDSEDINDAVRLQFAQLQGPDLPQVDREGVLTVDGEAHEVVLQDLPTVVEAYKSLDDTNLVKIADVGQVLLVVDPTIGRPNTYESDDGVTPPMRKARARHFKPRVTLPPEVMAEAVSDVVEMLAGRAPGGCTFHDVEEEYVVDPSTGQGRWTAVKPTKQPRAAAAAAAAAAAEPPAAKGAGRGRGRKKRANDSGDEDVEMSDSE